MDSIHHLNALRALEAAVRKGTFKAAAEELGVTSAAVGQQVRKLETVYGRVLLERSANGYKPTQTARSAVKKLEAGFQHLREAQAIISREDVANRLFLTVTPSIGERWLAPRLSDFLSMHSNVDLRIDSTPFVIYQPSLEFDFAIRYDKHGASGFDETVLFSEVLLPVCTPEIATRIGSVKSADCLAEAPLIHVDRSTRDPGWFHWEKWCQSFGYTLPRQSSGMHATYTTLALRSLYDGHGLHLAQLSITLPDLKSGRLVAPFGTSACVRPSYSYNLVQFASGQEAGILKSFRNWILDEAKSTQAEMNAYLDIP